MSAKKKITKKQLEANRNNSKKSTGPKTTSGKAKVSGNAIRHGIFSDKLVLPHESEEEFQDFHAELVENLKPIGVIELSLIVTITDILWKQRRLRLAEASNLRIQTLPTNIVKGVSDIYYGDDTPSSLKEYDLEPTHREYAKQCMGIKLEHENLQDIKINHWSELQNTAPHIYSELQNDAQSSGLSVDDFLMSKGSEQESQDKKFVVVVYSEPHDNSHDKRHIEKGLKVYLANLKDHYISELDKILRKPLILEIAEWVKEKNSISYGETEKLFSRYGTTLDNRFYKALKEFREQQKWRMSVVDGDADIID